MIDATALLGWAVLQFGDVGSEPGVNVNVNVDPAAGVASSAVGAFVLTVAVGAIMVALAPTFTEAMMERVRTEPVGSFVYGFTCVVFVVLVTIVLVITIVGIFVAIPFLLVVLVIWGIGSAIAFLAIAERLIDADEGWLKPLLLAGALNGGLTLTGIGGLVAFCIGAAGFGAVLRDYL